MKTHIAAAAFLATGTAAGLLQMTHLAGICLFAGFWYLYPTIKGTR